MNIIASSTYGPSYIRRMFYYSTEVARHRWGRHIKIRISLQHVLNSNTTSLAIVILSKECNWTLGVIWYWYL